MKKIFAIIKKNSKKIILVCLTVVFMLILFIGILAIKNIFFSLEEGPLIFTEKEISVYENISLSNLITEDIVLVDDKTISTTKTGQQNISFEYIYQDHKYLGNITINVIDDVAPTLFASATYTITKGEEKDFVNSILAGDNYDDHPTRKIIGTYDKDTIGTYNLTYYISDSSGNETTKDFKVKVVEKKSSSTKSTSKVSFTDVVAKHKNDQTEIGIDVSKWQGDIDFNKVKAAGCDFVIIRLGYQKGLDGEMIIDPYFQTNIENATKAGLKVGVYIYTYAKTITDAITQANWAIENIGTYQLDYGISYDWESWTLFNKTNLSYYHFTKIADTFLKYVEYRGYKGMLYSSKYYLENIWLETNHNIWLAHYTSNTSYQGKYVMWQITSNGRIDGINGDVDINIFYKNN